MKTRKSIARLLSFLMVLSLLLGISAAPVYAVGGEDSGQPQSGAEISFEPQQGASLTRNGGIITFTDSESGSIGTVQVYMGDSTDAYTEYLPTELTEARLAIPEGTTTVKIVLETEGELQAQLSYGGDIREAGAISGPVINEDTYTYTIIVANIPENDSGPKFVGITVEFGTNPGGGGDGSDAPVIWDGPQVEHQSDHGFISVKSIEIGSKTYTYQGEGKFAHNGDVNELLEWRGYNKTSIAEEGGIVVYGDVFTKENVDVFYINFEFNPDYGYQATHVRATEDEPIPLSDAGFSAAEAIRTFRFAVYPEAHTHFSVIFTATEDIVKANAASISEGGVELATDELDGGSAVLEVNEANISNRGDFEEAAEGYVVSEYLDISLYNVFYKGNAEDVWSTSVKNLDNPAEITLRLEDGIDTDTVKIVHEKGVGEFELLDAEYNPGTQEITFSTSSFSNYAIAYEEQAQGRYFIDFTNAPWTVDGVEVDVEGREPDEALMRWVTTEDVISLTNFDPDTMDAVLIVDEDVTLLLNVDENGNTRLADVDGGVEVLPPYGATMTFAVVAKPGGEGENVYYIDLGTGDWTVGDVTVSAPDGMSGVVPILDTETIPTEMLANFDPETMDITLTVSDGFVIYLEIDENGNTTLVSTRDGVELPPYGETLTFAVVAKPVDNEESETESYTITDDKGNVISLTYEKNRELSFTMIDYLAFSPEELEAAGIPQPLYDSMMEGIANATKQHGTLLSFYEIEVENDDGFTIHEGPFYIKIKMTDEMKKYDIFKIVYMDVEDNFATESPITLTRDGEYLVGTLEHLSTYALVGSNTPSSPQTGDNSNLGLWVFLLVLSSCSMIALIVIDKKRKIAK